MAIFVRISEGKLRVADACQKEGITRKTLHEWCTAPTDLGKALGDAYARAREQQAHALAELALSVADGNDPISQQRKAAIAEAAGELSRTSPTHWRKVVSALDANLIQRDRLRVDALKWYTSKIAPKLYGEKLDVTSGGRSVVTGVVVLPPLESEP